MILSLQSPTKDAQAALDKYNISLYDGDGKMRSMIDVLGDLRNATNGMTQEAKDALVGTIFNKTDLAAVNALLGTSAERFDELTGYIENASGAAQKMASTQLDNLAGDITLLKSAWEGLQIQISDKLAPALRKIVQFVTEVITHFDQIAPIVAGAATAFGVFAVAINMTNIIKSVTTAFTAFNAVLAANPIGLIVAAIAGLTVALVGLWNNNEQFRNAVIAAWESIKEAWNGMVERLKQAGEELKQDWENIKQSASQLAENVKQVWENIKQAVSNVVQGAVQWGSQLISNIVSGIQSMIGSVSSAVQNIGSSIRNGIQSIISGAANWGRDLMNNFINGIKSMFGSLSSAVSSAAQTVANFLHFSEPDEGPLSNFHTYAPDMMKLFAKGITDNADVVQTAFDKSLNFDTPTITANGISGSRSDVSGNSREIVFNVTELIDGSVLARNQYRFNLEEADRHGGNLINAYA